jgi:parallel beta-helix repeat protein
MGKVECIRSLRIKGHNMKKVAALVLILLCLTTLDVVCIRTVKAEWGSGVIIDADGSVVPPLAPVSRTGNTYLFTSDMSGGISIYRSNAVFDGEGHHLLGEVSLNGVSNVTVENFDITGSGGLQTQQVGISLTQTSNVTVANNTVTGMGSILAMNAVGLYAGIYVDDGSSNLITGNNLKSNIDAIYLYNTDKNLIVGNNITDMSNPWGIYGPGVVFDDASNNTVYHNNFSNPTGEQVSTVNLNTNTYFTNIWDDGYPGGGNYWSDYKTRYPSASEIDNTGIGNQPYVINPNNTDYYPLMKPFSESYLLNYLREVIPPKVSVLSPLNQTYRNSSVSLVFTVDKSVNWIGYSLDGQQNVTIAGNNTVTDVTYGLHSITVYANDTFGILGASQTVNFTVAKPQHFPTATVAAVSGAVAAVVVAAGLLVYFKKRKGDRKP